MSCDAVGASLARTRQLVLDEARLWIGTPYQHQASCRGAGTDCLGLIRGIWRALLGREPEPMPAYTPSWAESGAGEVLLVAARRHLVEIAHEAARPGDVLLFRPDLEGQVRHCAILSRPDFILHAYWGRRVCETALTPWWLKRRVAAFHFPSPNKMTGG